jgi:pimeloyl-ACP methyl ester carboxylesterase
MLQYIVGGIALYGVAVGGLYVLQDSLIFPRKVAEKPRYSLPPHSERLVLTTPDGHKIHGNLVRALGKSRGLILGFSGNAWNGDDCTVFLAHRVKDFDIAVFHYRGYAPSEGEPSERALFADARLIYDTLRTGMDIEHVYPIGFSLGSGVAAHLAANRDVAGILLVTPFDSIEEVASRKHPWAPVRSLIKHRFKSHEHLAPLDIPVAVIRASHDRVVPAPHTDALLEVVRNPVYVTTIEDATHGGIYDMDEIDLELVRALDALEAARG